jgi:hypothetical protein
MRARLAKHIEKITLKFVATCEARVLCEVPEDTAGHEMAFGVDGMAGESRIR